MTTKELGDIGEGIALRYLKKNEFTIVETNYRFSRNEIDIICKGEGKFIFIEVKTRQTSVFGPPWKAVNSKKQRQIIKCAHHYLTSNDFEEEVQFDIISIIHNSKQTEIEHIEDAFYPH